MRAINAAFIKSRNINYGQRVKRKGRRRAAVENLSSARQELLWPERKRSFRACLCRLEKGKWLRRTLPEVASESSWFITFLWTLINYLRAGWRSFHPELSQDNPKVHSESIHENMERTFILTFAAWLWKFSSQNKHRRQSWQLPCLSKTSPNFYHIIEPKSSKQKSVWFFQIFQGFSCANPGNVRKH